MTRRVLVVAPSAYPLGGVAAWLDQLVPGLRARGFDARALLLAGRRHPAARYRREHSALEPTLTVRCATGTWEGRVRALTERIATLDPEVVLAVNAPDAVSAVARLRARGARAAPRAVAAVHGLEPDLFLDLERLAPSLDAVICSNRLACALVVHRRLLPPPRVLHAAYGVDYPREPPPEPCGQSLVLGFAARLEQFQKRVQDLRPVLGALLARGLAVRLEIAGDGPDRAQVDALAREFPGRVHVRGALGGADMPAFHRACHALLNPSSWETGPIVVWEAMAQGRAVVSARYVGSGLEGALEHGHNCLLHPVGDTAAAAACVARLRDAPERQRVAAAGRALVGRRFTRERSVSAWADALDAVGELPPRAPTAPPPTAPAGRLDRWLGTGAGETLRAALGREFRHLDPGGEWPHSYAAVARDDPAHWALLRELDAGHAHSPLAAEAVPGG